MKHESKLKENWVHWSKFNLTATSHDWPDFQDSSQSFFPQLKEFFDLNAFETISIDMYFHLLSTKKKIVHQQILMILSILFNHSEYKFE